MVYATHTRPADVSAPSINRFFTERLEAHERCRGAAYSVFWDCDVRLVVLWCFVPGRCAEVLDTTASATAPRSRSARPPPPRHQQSCTLSAHGSRHPIPHQYYPPPASPATKNAAVSNALRTRRPAFPARSRLAPSSRSPLALAVLASACPRQMAAGSSAILTFARARRAS